MIKQTNFCIETDVNELKDLFGYYLLLKIENTVIK